MNNNQTKKKPVFRVFLVGCGTVAVCVIAIIVWIAVSLFSGPDVMERSTYHPFRSTEAKERYLKLYDAKARKWPVVLETRMVGTSFGQTFVRISGPVGASPLVLLHGSGGNSMQWIPNIEALSEKYRTYAVDNIYDNGRSVYTRAIESPDDFIKWLDELFSALDLGNNINLVGLSYGGWLTAEYAIRFPNRLDKIVLLAPVCTVMPLSKEWIMRAVLCLVPHRHFTRSFLYWLLEDLAQKEAGRALIEEHVEESYMALRSFKTKRMVNPTVLTDDELRGIKVPTLYLVGEDEKICSAQKALERLRKVAPQIKTDLIPNAGHDLTIVQADMVNKKILTFLHQNL